MNPVFADCRIKSFQGATHSGEVSSETWETHKSNSFFVKYTDMNIYYTFRTLVLSGLNSSKRNLKNLRLTQTKPKKHDHSSKGQGVCCWEILGRRGCSGSCWKITQMPFSISTREKGVSVVFQQDRVLC